MKTRDGHLDLLRLDAVRAGEGGADEAAHAAGCDACRRGIAALEAAGAALRAEERAPLEIPAVVDRRVLAAYRAELERRTRRPALRWLVPVGALAAAAVLALVLQPWRGRDDVNGDGVVDIVDAYVLSLRNEEGEGRPADAGRVASVDALARRAVALP